MLYGIIAGLLYASTGGAFAQQPIVQIPAEYNLKIKPVDVEKLGRGLGKLPYEDVIELMQNLRQQIIEQQEVANKPKPLPTKPK